MLNHSPYHNSIGGGNFDNTELTLSALVCIKRWLSLCIGAMAAVFLCFLSVACSRDDEPILQDKPFASPTDSTTQSGGSGFIFGDDEPEITIPLDLKHKITNSTDI